MGISLLVPLVLVALAIAVGFVPWARRRPARLALLLALVTVGGGLLEAGGRAAEGIIESRIDYSGVLDVETMRRTFHPTGRFGLGDPLPHIKAAGHGCITNARGEMVVPRAGGVALGLWSLHVLGPWLLAAVSLALLAPILLAAERGDPFRADAQQRLSLLGMLLLVAVPALTVLGYVSAETASATGSFAAPVAEPSLTLTPMQLVPGALVLTLAGIFGRGAALRDLDRHTI